MSAQNVTAVSSKTDELLLCFSYCSSLVHYLKYLLQYLYITLMERKTLQCALNGFKWMLLKSIMKVMERVRSDISPE